MINGFNAGYYLEHRHRRLLCTLCCQTRLNLLSMNAALDPNSRQKSGFATHFALDVTRFLAGVGIVLFLLHGMLLTKTAEVIATRINIDDTYYYLLPAWHLKTLGFVTFDGINPTNGVQLLWFFVLSLLVWLAPNQIVFMYQAVIACALLNAACYPVIGRIGQITGRPYWALGAALLWTLETFYIKEHLFGMENSLHAFIFWVLIWQMVRFAQLVQQRKPPNLVLLTLLLILNGWARLDSALLSVVFYGGAILFWRRHNSLSWSAKHGFAFARSVALALAGAATQLGLFYWMGGSLLPVSGLIKSESSGPRAEDLGAEFLRYLELSYPSEIIQRDWPSLVHLVLMIGVLALVIHTVRRTYRPLQRTAAFGCVWLALALGLVLYHLVIFGSGARYEGYFTWYRSPQYIFWIMSLAVVLDGLLTQPMFGNSDASQSRTAPPRFNLQTVLLTSIALSLAAGFNWHRSPINQAVDPQHIYTVRYHAAEWVKQNYPPEVRLAAWNAGQTGYFSQRSVINLDGLINSYGYYQEVLTGEKPLEQYLAEMDVDFILDYEDNPITRSLPVEHEFPNAGKRHLKMWRLNTK